jgi:hypothetical protein
MLGIRRAARRGFARRLSRQSLLNPDRICAGDAHSILRVPTLVAAKPAAAPDSARVADNTLGVGSNEGPVGTAAPHNIAGCFRTRKAVAGFRRRIQQHRIETRRRRK